MDIKIPKKSDENVIDRKFVEEFSKKWEIATSRLKPFLAEKEDKKDDRGSKIYSYR